MYLCACGAPPLSVAASVAGDDAGDVVTLPEVSDAGDAAPFVDELEAPEAAPLVVDARPVDAGAEASCEAGRVGWIYNDQASGLVYYPPAKCDPCALSCACLMAQEMCTYGAASTAPPKSCTQSGSTFLLCCEHPGAPDLGCAPRDQ